MFWSILHRMILWELTKVFVLSLVGITGILLMAGIIAEASQQGLSPGQILEIIPFLIPSTLPYTIPATTLFATCVVYGRLAHDNEILAIRAAGINVMKVVWPAVLLGLVMSTSTMALYYRIIPYTHRLLRTMFLKDVEEGLYAVLNRDKQINYPGLDYAIFVRRVEARKLFEAVFKQRDRSKKDGKGGGYKIVAWAREADLRVDLSTRTVLVGMKYGEALDDSGEVKDGVRGGLFISFEKIEYAMPLPTDATRNKTLKPRDMSWQEILGRRNELIKLQELLTTQIALLAAPASVTGPLDLQKHVQNVKEMQRYKQVEMHTLDTELHMRAALAFGCLFFVMVGCPIGIWFSKSDYLSAFIICFLPIVFLYYPLMLAGSGMAKDGKVSPLLSVWAADAVMAGIAAVLYWRLLKH